MDQKDVNAQSITPHPPDTEISQAAPAPVSIQETPTVTTSTSPRSVEELAEVILSRKGQITDSFIEIGDALIEAKEQLIKHGGWLKWLSDVVDIPPWTAERYMKLARSYSNSTAVQNLDMTKALALLSIPDNERESFINDTHNVNGQKKTVSEMSSRELKKVIKKKTNPSNDNQKKSTYKPITKDSMRKDFLSNIDTALECLNKGMKFLDVNEGSADITEEFRKSLDSLNDVAKKCKERISSKISTENKEKL